MEILFILFVAGLSAGGIYALIGVGLVLIYKATDVVNFAQGEIAMLGAYLGFIFLNFLHIPYLLAFLLAVAGTGAFGLLLDRAVFRGLIGAPIWTIILATLAVGITLKSLARLTIGSDTYPLPPLFSMMPWSLGGIPLTPLNLGVILISTGLVLLLSAFFRFTRLGKAMRATSQNQFAAVLMGISVKRVFSLAWVISAIFGAAAGLLLAPLLGINPEMGWVAVKGFAAAVAGGFTSLPGVVVGGFLLGVSENFAGVYLSTAYKEAVAFVLLIVLLAVKPTGLFERQAKKRA